MVFADDAADVIRLGEPLDIHGSLRDGDLLLHPDVAATLDQRTAVAFEGFTVSPTASARTVHAFAQPPFHLKLHYGATIGRMDRSLGIREASYAVYVSRLLSDAVAAGALPDSFGILPEPSARVLKRDNGSAAEMGMVYRALTPASRSPLPAAMVPAFSLFSQDRLAPHAPPLLLKIWQASNVPAFEFVTDFLALPLIDAYFRVLLSTGLQGEFHAQNVVIGLDRDGIPRQILLRDMESVDSDLSLQHELRLSIKPPPATHKCIDRSMPNYQIKHSFMFDFKLGEYLLAPIIDIFERHALVTPDAVAAEVRQRVRRYVRELPGDFFPPGCWYSFARVQIDRSTSSRPYVRHEGTRFR